MRTLLPSVAAIAALALSPLPARAQPRNAGKTHVRHIFVSVTDAKGAPVEGLTPAKVSEAAPSDATAASVETIEQPEAVAIAGDFNILLGAPANWAPQYDESQMKLDAVDQLWKLTTDLPAGHYSFKIALNRSWDENYGAFGAFDGANHELHHSGGRITFNYDHRSRDITLI